MRVLVVGTPKFQVPPDQLPSIVDGAIAWHERYQDKFESFGLFPGGGGFGVVKVDDEAELNQLILEMPFSWFSDVQIRPAVEAEVGWQQLQQAVQSMAAMA
jgi:hypothetical protein